VSTDPGLRAAAAEPRAAIWEPRPQRAPTGSACFPARYASVRRFVAPLRW